MELQSRETVLTQAAVESVQGELFTTCVPEWLPAAYVDHLDTVPGSARVTDVPGGGLAVRLDVEVFGVLESDVVAHPNAAATPASVGVVDVVVHLGLRDRALVVQRASADTTGLPVPARRRATVREVLDARLARLDGRVLFDLAPLAAALGTVSATEPGLGRGQGVVALRLGPGGPVISHLSTEQDWGVFLEVGEVTALLERQLPAGLGATVTWQPNGAAPAMSLTMSLDLGVLGDIDGVGTVRPTLVAAASLRMSCQWGVDLTGVLGVLEPAVRRAFRLFLRARLPQATHDGAQSFFLDLDLPPIPAVLGARPSWDSIGSTAAGMTLGGQVRPAPAGGRGLLHVTPSGFGRPLFWSRCRSLAGSGSGRPPTRFHVSDPTLRSMAGAGFTDAGALCGAGVLAPEQWLSASGHLRADQDGMSLNLSLGSARRITSDVRVLVRTARGVRLVDLGRPRIRVDGDGQVDVQVNHLEDCLRWSGPRLKLLLGEQLTVNDFRGPRLEDPDWIRDLRAEIGVNSHVLTLVGLDPGETVVVHGAGLHLAVVAGDTGEALVPGLVALAPTLREVVLERESGAAVTGPVLVRTVAFTWLAEVGPADAAHVVDVEGRARVARLLGEELVVEDYEPDAHSPFTVAEDLGVVSLNPQPLPPQPPEALRLAAAASLDDVAAAYSLPGHDDVRLALVRTGQGELTVVVDDGHGARVAGSFSGSVIGMQVDHGFAIARSGPDVHLFAVLRHEDLVLESG